MAVPPSGEAANPPPTTPAGGGAHPGGPITAGPGPFHGGATFSVSEGGEYVLSFFFYIEPTAYRLPGEENLIVQLGGAEGEQPSFALQLWDDGGEQRGLWSSGEAMGGERFLAPLAEGVWHRAVVYFRASSAGDGFYLLTLDGEPVDARAWISLIEAENGSAELEIGLSRDGEPVPDAPDVFFGPAELGDSSESVIP